jgi:hypothetical protein
MSDFFYAKPVWSFLFALLPLIFLLYFSLERYRAKVAKKLNARNPESANCVRRSRRFFWLRVFFLLQVVTFLILALMQPVEPLEKIADSEKKEGVHLDEVVCLLDTSASMLVQDASFHKSRLERAKEIINHLAESISGAHLSLYTFTSSLENSVPATLDYLYFRIVLADIGINEPGSAGTDFYTLFMKMKEKYVHSTTKKNVRFLLFTDGEDTTIEDLSGDEKKAEKKELQEFFLTFKKGGMFWDVVGMGRAQGGEIPGLEYEGKAVRSKCDTEFLEWLSQVGHGHLYLDQNLSSERIVDGILANITRFEKEGDGKREKEVTSVQNKMLGCALFFFVLALLLEHSPWFCLQRGQLRGEQ